MAELDSSINKLSIKIKSSNNDANSQIRVIRVLKEAGVKVKESEDNKEEIKIQTVDYVVIDLADGGTF